MMPVNRRDSDTAVSPEGKRVVTEDSSRGLILPPILGTPAAAAAIVTSNSQQMNST